MKSICFFNNKGGVGKTTLVCNVASYIATQSNLKILLVDADPQCNATQLVLGDDVVATLYGGRTSELIPGNNSNETDTQTLYDILRPIALGEAVIAQKIVPIESIKNRFRIDIVPGNPNVALLEDLLSREWGDLLASKPSGIRKTNWNTQLCRLTSAYDIVFFDVGPSLGALNRSVLVGVDHFVTPMGCDIFSIMGIENISKWFKSWIKDYKKAISDYDESEYHFDLNSMPIKTDGNDIARFLGYTVQQYITKSFSGKRRPTVAFERILKEIPKAVQEDLEPFNASSIPQDRFHLGDVPNMFSLVPLAQKASAAIHLLDSSDGLVGAQYAQKESYVNFIRTLSSAIIANAQLPQQHDN